MTEGDDLDAARGVLNGLVLSLLFFWLPLVVILAACSRADSSRNVARIEEPKTIFVTLYPDYQSLQEAYRTFQPDDWREVLAFAQLSPCRIHIVSPQSSMDGKFAESFEHELRHCTDGAWHQ